MALQCTPQAGSRAVGYHAASARNRCKAAAFNSATPVSAAIGKTDIRLTRPEPSPPRYASRMRRCRASGVRTVAFQRKPGTVGATWCWAVKASHRALRVSALPAGPEQPKECRSEEHTPELQSRLHLV